MVLKPRPEPTKLPDCRQLSGLGGLGGRSLVTFLLAAKVKICGVEVWSSEVEVKLLEGHRGEGGCLTCRAPPLSPVDPPQPSRLAVAIFRDVNVGGSASPGGSRRVDPLAAATTQLRRS